jgi:FAD/FMN-containing dehydrogenase
MTAADTFFTAAIPAAPYDELRARTAGAVVVAGEPEYEALVTPWNLAIEVRPDAVVAAQTAQDVVEAVRFAREHGLEVTPQATGHGAITAFIGEILVNTKGLDECVVHPEGWARVGAGVKWLRVVEAAAPYGLAPLSGSVTDVGIVGYTTGGGLGPMARTYGLASDRVRAIEVVTGDGELRRVTPAEHSDLFFALRGGKGALGIVTAVEFDLVRQPRFYGGSLWFDGDHAAAVIAAWREWIEDLPETATTSFGLFNLPEMPGVPPMLAGKLTLSIRYLWTGDSAEGEEHFAAMRAAAPVLLDDVAEKPYTAVDSVHTDPVDPLPAHESAMVLRDFPAAAADELLRLAGPGSGSTQVLVEVRQMGGATARPGEHDSAFAARDAAYSLLVVSIPMIPGAVEHGQQVVDAMRPWFGTYRLPNFTSDAALLPKAYDDWTRAKLRHTIRRYDPDGVIAIGHAFAV